jgi:hypothetical protein
MNHIIPNIQTVCGPFSVVATASEALAAVNRGRSGTAAPTQPVGLLRRL